MLSIVAVPAHTSHGQQPADGSPTDSRRTDQWPLARGDAQSSGATPQTLADDLRVVWEFEADEAIETTPIVYGSFVYVADVMGTIYAIDRADGAEKWRRDFETGFLASPSIRRGLIVIGDVDGTLYAMDPETGRELWKRSTDGEINGSASFYGQHVLATSQDGKLYCLRAKDGSIVWEYQTDDQVRCSPTIAGDRTFLGGCDGQLHVVNLKTGDPMEAPLPLGGPTGSTPAVSGHRAFVPIMDGSVLAFDWKEHKQLWSFEDEDRPQEYRSSAAVSGDRVIVSSQSKQVDAISAASGERLWTHTLRRRADGSPVIAGSDVWLAATDGRLVRLDLESGREKWQYEVRGSFYASPAIAGDKLFVADDDGIVRCFGPAPETEMPR
jgi:outer membrane protein assembly factor BamB